MSSSDSYVAMPAISSSMSSSLLPSIGSSDSYSTTTDSAPSTSSSQSSLLQKLHPYRYYIAIAVATLLIIVSLSAVMLARGNSGSYMGPYTPTNTTNGDNGGQGGGDWPGPPGPPNGDGGDTGSSYVAANSSCAQAKILTEGPYWVDEKLNRSDLYSTATGQMLTLEILVFNTSITNKCVPIPNAMVDLWTSDASGLYSDEQILGTKGKTFLRGYQMTNADGLVNFMTIWPGWYQGRTVHLHFRVRVMSADGKTVIYNQTTQLFVDDTTSDAIFSAVAPYNGRTGKRDTYNKNDNMYSAALLVNTTGSIKEGFVGSFALGVPFLK